MKILVTGGCGFIGSHFIRRLLHTQKDCSIVNLDCLTYAGSTDRLQDIEQSPRYRFVHANICDIEAVDELMSDKPDAVVHFAAESHVDRSIAEPEHFVRSNILGTQVLLDTARKYSVPRFIHISTDEVYGSLGPDDPAFTEDSPLKPNSPYSASKAAADLLVRATVKTHSFPAIITRCSNNYGPYQHTEKMIPLFISNLLHNKSIPLYGNGKNIRDWIHVDDHCAAIELILLKGKEAEVYNIGANNEQRNIDIANELITLTGKSNSLLSHVEDRPGHDFRYALNTDKLTTELGWQAKIDFTTGLNTTVQWYKKNI